MPDFKRYIDDEKLPYSPFDVDIRQQSFPIDVVVQMIDMGEIELWRPEDFQRLGGLWSLKEKSRLIESILMNIPLPIFYLDGSKKPWKIIDGLQRLTVLHQFINEESFALQNLQYQSEIEGLNYHNLPFQYQRRIRTFLIQAYIINPGTPEQVKFNIFHRINTFGIKLNAMEIRNGYYSGIPSSFILELTQLPAFQQTIGSYIPSKRMKDREYALRFFAFNDFPYMFSPPMDDFLDRAMNEIRRYSDYEREAIKTGFNRALETCIELFGENAFFIINGNGGKVKTKPNIALFETWTVNLSKRDEKIHKRLIRNKDYLLTRYADCFNDREFLRAITSSTTSWRSLELRFSTISDLIETSI